MPLLKIIPILSISTNWIWIWLGLFHNFECGCFNKSTLIILPPPLPRHPHSSYPLHNMRKWRIAAVCSDINLKMNILCSPLVLKLCNKNKMRRSYLWIYPFKRGKYVLLCIRIQFAGYIFHCQTQSLGLAMIKTFCLHILGHLSLHLPIIFPIQL